MRAFPPALLCCALAAACGRATDRPNALLITLDTTRADALSCYGLHAGVTPALDRLASEGVLFERAYTTVPIPLPAHASMLTGLVPPRHTVRDNGLAALPDEAHTLAEAAAASGYQTAAFLAAVVLHRDFGLDQGFDVYELPRRPERKNDNTVAERSAREVVDAALGWLDARDTSAPFLLWVHLYDPHGPYEPPPLYRKGPWGDDPYLGEVAAMDHEIGRLLDALRADGTLDETFVLVVGDHGEAFGEQREIGHGAFCYESTLRVPLLLRSPDGSRAGERVEALTSVVDVYPTLLEALGLALPADIDGTSLLGAPAPDRGVYFESYYGYLSYGWSPLAGWMNADGKLLASSEPQFFDLSADPAESHDLYGSIDVARHERAIALAFSANALEPADPDGIDGSLIADIESLGYAGTTGAGGELPHPLKPGDLPSPQSRADVQERTVSAFEHINHGELAAAETIYRGILAENPRNWYVLEKLATLQMQADDPRAAIETLERLLDSGQEKAANQFKLGVCYRAVGRDEEALGRLRLAVEGSRGRALFVGQLADLLRELGRHSEAEELERRHPND